MEKYNSNSEATSKICGPGKRDEHLKTKRTLWTWHWDNVFIVWREGSGPLGVPECNHSNKNSWKPELRSPLSYIHVEVFTCSHWQLLVQHMPHRTQQKCGDQYSGISCHMHLQCENSTLECLEHGICEDQTATPLHSTTRDMQNISVESRKKWPCQRVIFGAFDQSLVGWQHWICSSAREMYMYIHTLSTYVFVYK